MPLRHIPKQLLLCILWGCLPLCSLAQKEAKEEFPETLYTDEEMKALGIKPKKEHKPYTFDSLTFERNKINTYYLYLNQAINPAYAGIGTKTSVYYGFDATYPTQPDLYENTHRAMIDWAMGKKKNNALGIVYERQSFPVGTGTFFFRRTLYQLNYAGNIRLFRSHNLRLGFSAGYEINRMDSNLGKLANLDNYSFGDMIDPRYGFVYETQEIRFGDRRGYPTFNAGMMYLNKFMQFAVSSTYITQPRNGFITIGKKPMNTYISLCGFIPLAQLNLLNPYVVMQVSKWGYYDNAHTIYNIKGGINAFFLKYAYLGVAISNLRYLSFSAGVTAFHRLRIGVDNDVFYSATDQSQFAPIRSINVHIRYVSKK